MTEHSQKIKLAISWAVVVVTILATALWLGYLGSRDVSYRGPGLSGWIYTFALVFITGLLPVFSCSVALRNRKWGASVCFYSGLLLGLWFVWPMIRPAFPRELSQRSGASGGLDLEYLGFTFLLLALPGVFWFTTDRLRWEPMLPKGGIRLGATVVTMSLFLVVVSVSAVVTDLYSVSNDSFECHFYMPPFAKQQFPEQAVFEARVLQTGLLWPPRATATKYPRAWRKRWALAVVNRHFWGLPWWDHKFVVLVDFDRGVHDFFVPGETYFIDGRRRPGSLTRYLPIFGTFCTRTDFLKDAEIDLRIIQDGLPSDGIRILGRTLKLTTDDRWEYVSGVKVIVRGPAGDRVTVSDQNGVFDFLGLPPGQYEIGRQDPNGIAWQHPSCMQHEWQSPSKSGDVRDCAVIVR